MIETILLVVYPIVLSLFVFVVLHEKKQVARDRERLAKTVNTLSMCVEEFRETARSLESKVAGLPSKKSGKFDVTVVVANRTFHTLVPEKDWAAARIRTDWTSRFWLSIAKSRVRVEDECAPEYEAEDTWPELAEDYHKKSVLH